MAYLKVVNDLHIALQEMQFWQESVDKNGFRKNILDNSVAFGLIKSNRDVTFANGSVTQDTDLSGDKTIKIAPLTAIDAYGNFLVSDEIRQLVVPNDGTWYWLKTSYATSNLEAGTVSIDASGNVTGVGTKFTELLRGIPNFPSKIKLINSVYNTIEYMVNSVIDDTHLILQNPAVDTGGVAEFAVESNLTWGIVGTFTPGISIPSGDKFPYVHDSITYSLVAETSLNTRPIYTPGVEFFLARVNCTSGTLKVQDKRLDYWQTKGSDLVQKIMRTDNPLIGVETVKWSHPFSPSDKNLVEVAWAFRSANWSLNSNQNILTLASGQGGKYKSASDFNDGDLNGWRVYTSNGKYSIVVSSYGLAGAINLVLDVLDVDNYSSDGGTTMLTQTVVIAPDCEEVSIWCLADSSDNTPNVTTTVTFPTYLAIGTIQLECYKDPTCAYNLQYSYQSTKEATGWKLLPSDTIVGYLNESSFDSSGNQIATNRTTYIASGPGFIILTLATWAYHNFSTASYKGDKIGVNFIPALFANPAITYQVGRDAWVQVLTGSHTLSGDTTLTLDTANAQNGNIFTFIFDSPTIALSGFTLRFKEGTTTIYDFTQSDIYEAMNAAKGTKIEFRYSGSQWIPTASYTPAPVGSIVTIDGVLASLFDISDSVNNAMGKVKSLFGYSLCNHTATINGVSVPDLSIRFLVGIGTSRGYTFLEGDNGGNTDITLSTAQLPSHNHSASQGNHSHTFTPSPHDHRTADSFANLSNGDSGIADHAAYGDGAAPTVGSNSSRTSSETAGGTISSDPAGAITIGNTGSGNLVNILNPYYAVIYAKKIY